MRFTITLSLVAAVAAQVAVTGKLGNAVEIMTNPTVAYTAEIHGMVIEGKVMAVAQSGGPVAYEVSFANLPKEGGPFGYHIHAAPVPANGNCTATLAHLDPYQRGQAPSCDRAKPMTCEVGDLSGKHGAITSDPFAAKYTDSYTSTNPSSSSFIGNLSVTLHNVNKTRLGCANFKLVKVAA